MEKLALDPLTRHAQKKETKFTGFIGTLIKNKVLLLFLLPGLIVMVVNNYLPMAGLIAAFKNIDYAKGLLGSPFVGFKNFRFLFATSDAWEITRNTVLYNLVFIFLGLFINVVVAICLNEIHRKRLAKLFQTIYMLPYFLSMVVVAYAVYGFLNPGTGFINTALLPAFGINPIDWYLEPKYWVILLPLVNFWVYTGVGSVIYIASITGIDGQMFEAAVVDGATKIQQIIHITLPTIKPVMVIMTLLSLGNIFRGNFGLFYQVPMASPALLSVTNVIDTYVYRAMTTSADMGLVMAASFYQSVVGCVMVVLANFAVRKIDEGSSLF